MRSDIAENFLVRGEVEEGDVMVVDLSSEEGLTKSKKPYSSLVVGVISKNPAIIIGEKKGGENYKPVALKGVVLTKVIGPVKRGDILVTSNKEGYAMKADSKKIFSPTQIVGIALEELKEKEGKIKKEKIDKRTKVLKNLSFIKGAYLVFYKDNLNVYKQKEWQLFL